MSSAALLPKRHLGSTGIDVSCLGLGTVKFGRNEGVKYPAGFALPDDRSVQSILQQCAARGMNLIDTAPAYGKSEKRLGQLLENRQEWVICSKVGEEFDKGTSHFDFSASHTRKSIERSLKRLRTDYLDIVLVHSDGSDEAIIHHSDCLETLQRAREDGLIRAYGMSTKTVAGGLLTVVHADIVMVTLNPSATDDRVVIEAARKQGKGVLIKKALNSGHVLTETSEADQQTQDPVQNALDFIFANAGVGSVIIGSITPQHLQHNIDCAVRAASR
jgi:aryl-alcohol dehydrogenase-like predicted oxidoreductase